jgi:TolB-like protein
MAAEVKKEIELEIAHVLFIDIVAYSKMAIDDQRAAIEELNQVVQSTDEFRKAESESRLLKLATGDGMALIFYHSPEDPVECALEISRALKEQPRLKLRMGVHSGPVSGVVDVSGRANIAGAGINVAQRVMDCGDAGHILLSKRVAEDLEQFKHWRPHLYHLGECEAKHGEKIDIVNLFTAELGNSERPGRLTKAAAKADAVPVPMTRPPTRKRLLIITVCAAIAALLVSSFLFWPRQKSKRSAVASAVAEKSIAVLPFENLSEEKANAFFADGVQDEILTDLAKIPDLKVISRTSVIRYRTDVARDLREIGQQLGVAHVVEGSVQRSGDRIRVNAQLIDARTDTHLWARTYDRNLADVFAIQSEIAKAIAQELQANLSPNLKASIEKPPTADLLAFDLYTRAKTLLLTFGFSGQKKGADLYKAAAELLTGAIARDRDFLLAYCLLSEVHGYFYFFAFDHTPARLEMAENAIRNAQRLQPGAGETHLALAQYFYRCRLDYDRAREELRSAARLLPNNSDVYTVTSSIDRRQSRWDDSVRNMEKALQLDPRSLNILRQLSLSYQSLRRYADMAAVLDRCLAIDPTDVDARIGRALTELRWHANAQPLHDTIHDLISAEPSMSADFADWWFNVALCERNPAEISAAVSVISNVGIRDENLIFPRAFCEGFADYVKGDLSAARSAFNKACAEQERIVREQPGYGPALCVLGVIDAALGRKDEAMGEGRRAAEMVPLSKDSVNAVYIMKYLALIYAWCGEKDLAIDQIKATLQHPGDLSYGFLKLHPYWDPLRGDPRFEKIVASLVPKP